MCDMPKTTKSAEEFLAEMQATPLWDRLPDEVVTVIRNRGDWFDIITDPGFSVVSSGTLVKDVLTSIAESWALYDGDVNVALFRTFMPYALGHTHKEMYARCMAAVWLERARCVREGLVDTEE